MSSSCRSVPLSSLQSYASQAPSPRSSLSGDPQPRTSEVVGLTQSVSPFPVNELLNSKIAFYSLGPAYNLETDGLLIATNESFTERGGIVGEVWKLIGRDLEQQCRKAEKVRTGKVPCAEMRVC